MPCCWATGKVTEAEGMREFHADLKKLLTRGGIEEITLAHNNAVPLDLSLVKKTGGVPPYDIFSYSVGKRRS